jgi:hypothetical protein
MIFLLRQKKVQEEGCKGEPGTVRVSPANKKLFPNNMPPAARRARSNGGSVGRPQDEMHLPFCCIQTVYL